MRYCNKRTKAQEKRETSERIYNTLMKGPGQIAYEADVSARPNYHDGSRRKTWDELGDVEKWSWTRPLEG